MMDSDRTARVRAAITNKYTASLRQRLMDLEAKVEIATTHLVNLRREYLILKRECSARDETTYAVAIVPARDPAQAETDRLERG